MSLDVPSHIEQRVVASDLAGERLDAYLARQFPQYSRVHLRKEINAAAVRVNGCRQKAAYRVRAGDCIEIRLPPLPRQAVLPENIPLQVIFEDEHLAVVNKPAGMVVHPARGHWSGTLTAALQYHFNQLSRVGGPTRPGVVHRLDRDTSGLLVVAKTDAAHFRLSEQFAQRSVHKEYLALVVGVPDRDRDVIDRPIGLHPYQREKMAVRPQDPRARPAQTFYEVLERFRGFAALRVVPYTGRTHQIRVHLHAIGCPVLCDRLYGGRARITRAEIAGMPEPAEPSAADVLLERQALHAHRLRIEHPHSGALLEVVAPLPDDMRQTLEALRELRGWRPPA
jgi:23S rRNA pseudouridine1911/1915/1917 synthase